MASTVNDLISQEPTNVIQNFELKSYTNKPWATAYPPIGNFSIHSVVDETGFYHANFDSVFHPLDADDQMRFAEPASFPNPRFWRLETEADMEHWWHDEVSDVVMAAWANYPTIVQTSHTKPLTDVHIPENVDSTYAMYINNMRTPLVIGEIKRNLIKANQWQTGNLTAPQKSLSSELRGYADKYQCPQVFCYDGAALILLQFRATQLSEIRQANCPVDCWVILWGSSACTMRYALYRLMAQGLRRCQGLTSTSTLSVCGFTQQARVFFNGLPLWPAEPGKLSTVHPGGYYRAIEPTTGALKWIHEVDGDGAYETAAFK